MRDLDKSDLTNKEVKILKELDINARQSASAIGKKLRMSKQVVNYHIDNMIKRGLIKEFITYVDTQKLGYTFYNILIKLKYMTNQEKEKIVNRLKAIANVSWLSSFQGEWQMIVCILAKDVGEFSMYLDEVLTSLKGKLLDYNFFIVISASQLGYKKIHSMSKGSYNYLAKISTRNPSYLPVNDLKVLKVIANNARLSTVDIARKARLTIEKVRYSLKNLEKDKVIQAYKPLLNVFKLGYLWNVMFIRLKSSDEKEKVQWEERLKHRLTAQMSIQIQFFPYTLTAEEFHTFKPLLLQQLPQLKQLSL
jgi:Lrp/AsnC family transcriptional regulator, leucine-responsive regulatory protein